ncbi:MAG: cobalamin-dependent protein [Desulfobacteraceae bacterium]
MNVLLVYPPVLQERVHQEEVAVPPIGLYYVGALLRENGHDVEILNAHALGERPGDVEDALIRVRPDVVGFSVLHANRWGALDLARLAKRVVPGVQVVFGGVGTTFLWEQLLAHTGVVDYVVRGEGERTFLELVGHLERGEDSLPGHIHGLAFLKHGHPFKTPDAPRIKDLDSLPNPAKYFTYQHVAATRGCAMNCAFCGSPLFWGRTVRAHSPGYFVEQLELLYLRGVRFFFFSDDTFTADRTRVLEICRRILDRGLAITWFAIARVDHVDEEMLRWMRRAGCIQISYGVESGSPAIRKRLNKPLRAEKIRRAFSLTRRFGILPRAYFIYGCPGETRETVEETLALLHEIQPLAAIFYILDVFPGTALCEEMKREGRLTEDVWLDRIEGVPYFELDPCITQDAVLGWGETLRDGFHQEVGGFAASLELTDEPGFETLNADFCSRLGMTFSHGDYARIEAIPDADHVAETLYRYALAFHPDHRAYLGLAILCQKQGDYVEAVRLLEKGISSYPDSEPLNVCLGVSYMNLGRFREALDVFSRFEGSADAERYAASCREALGL